MRLQTSAALVLLGCLSLLLPPTPAGIVPSPAQAHSETDILRETESAMLDRPNLPDDRDAPVNSLAHQVRLPLTLRNYPPGPPNQPPNTPSLPLPNDGASEQPTGLTLTWTSGDPDGDAVTYDVYLDADDDTPETLICDDVSSPACDPGALTEGIHYYWQVIATDEHDATTEGPVWEFTTISPGCEEQIANGSFEASNDWERPVTAYRARYSTTEAHSGSRSMRVSIVDPADNVRSYSSARQWVTIPADANSAALRFWLYPISDEAGELAVPQRPLASSPEEATLTDDAQYVLVLNESGDWIDTLLWQRRDDRDWTYHEVDLLDYADQTIKLHFGVFNDGGDGVTGIYLDDVSLVVCSP